MLTKTIIPKALTVKIIKALQSGVAPWRIPWTGFENTGFPCEVGTGQPFRGVNALLLNLAAMEQGFQSRWWATGRGLDSDRLLGVREGHQDP